MKIIPYDVKSGQENMRIDSELLDGAIQKQLKTPLFRLYGWSPACVSLGRNQKDDFIDYEYRIKQNEIWEYACDLAADNNDNPLLVRLMIADNTVDFFSVLHKLAADEKLDFEFEKRKWIVYVLHKAVYSLPATPSFEDLFKLTDLWGYLGRPKHYPWNPETDEYVKVSDYAKMIDIHKRWIDMELNSLRR